LVKSHVEESLGANPADAALNPADSVAMGVPSASVPREARGRGGAFDALQHASFRLLFAAFLINQLGFWISHISIQGLMVDLTDNDPMMVGALFFALFVPAFVLAPIAGVAADRFDRKRIVLGCYAAVAVVTGCLSLAVAAGLLAPNGLLVFALALGTCFAFSGPANMAIAANSVPAHDLASAVSIQSALNNLTRVLGPALAAPLLVSGRFEVAFAIFFLAAFVAGVLTARMKIAPYELEAEEGGIFARLRSGFHHARERRPTLPALITVAVLSLFGVSHVALIPVFAEHQLGDRDLFAWMVAVTGIGAVAGALVTGQLKAGPTLRGASIQCGLYGILLLAFSQTYSVALALLTQLAIGYFYFAVMTSLQTVIQQIVAESKRGRVMSLFQIAWAGLVPFGGLGMGAAAQAFGASAAIAAGAVVLVAFGAVMTLLAPRLSAPPTSVPA
jgi:MFS family permease